jgi:uncharacterized membrane protein
VLIAMLLLLMIFGQVVVVSQAAEVLFCFLDGWLHLVGVQYRYKNIRRDDWCHEWLAFIK